MLRNLVQPYDKAWIVPVPNHISWGKAELSKACPDLAEQLSYNNEVEQILSKLQKDRKWPSPEPVIAGSLYLIGDLLLRGVIKD